MALLVYNLKLIKTPTKKKTNKKKTTPPNKNKQKETCSIPLVTLRYTLMEVTSEEIKSVTLVRILDNSISHKSFFTKMTLNRKNSQ